MTTTARIDNSASQTIATKPLLPTNTKGMRIKARTVSGKSITLAWDHGLDGYGNAATAAAALMDRMGWDGRWVGGASEYGGDGYVFVRVAD